MDYLPKVNFSEMFVAKWFKYVCCFVYGDVFRSHPPYQVLASNNQDHFAICAKHRVRNILVNSTKAFK